MRDFSEIFDLGANFFQVRGVQLTRQEFIEDTKDVQLDFGKYETCKPTLTAAMALRTNTEQEERDAMLSVLNHNHHIEDYINDNLDKEDTFYLLNKKFFDAWSLHVGFTSSLEKNSSF